MTGILTAVGEAKVAGSIGGTAINFAVIRIGDGNGAAIAPNRLMTDLVRRVGGAYPVTTSARDPDNPTHWRVTTEIPAGQGPFTLREIAVFDAAGDMLAIAPHPVVEFTGPGGDQISIITDIVFPVSGTANVSVTISPSAAVPLARNLRPFFMAVESASTLAPPATPAAGVTYIVPANATGAWAGQAGNLAQWTGENWSVASAPVGHIVCVMDQAVSAEGRFQRRTAGGWTTAKATDAAYGVSRLATAQEVANKTPGVAVPADLLPVPTRFETYDNLTFIVVRSGAVSNPPAVPAGQRWAYPIAAGPTGAWAGQAGGVAISDGSGGWAFMPAEIGRIVRVRNTQAFYENAGLGVWNAVTFPAASHNHQISEVAGLQSSLDGKAPAVHTHPYLPLAGGVLTGAVASNSSISTEGYLTALQHVSSVPSNNAFVRTVWVGGVRRWMDYLDVFDALSIYNETSGRVIQCLPNGNVGFGNIITPTEKVHINGNLRLSGALKLAGGFGSANQVAVSAAGGANTWANVIDLITTAQVRAKVGGKTIIAVGVAGSGAVVTFPAAEPDTSYSAIVFNGVTTTTDQNQPTIQFGSISSKTVTGCTVNGSGQAGATNIVYIIYR